MSLKRVDYTDQDGRKKAVYLPEDALEEDPASGIPIGPPPLAALELPLEIEVRLNNELYHRNILTGLDALKHRDEIGRALQAALRADLDRVLTMYLGEDFKTARAEKVVEESPRNIRTGARRRK